MLCGLFGPGVDSDEETTGKVSKDILVPKNKYDNTSYHLSDVYDEPSILCALPNLIHNNLLR